MVSGVALTLVAEASSTRLPWWDHGNRAHGENSVLVSYSEA
jgi:hypothetical protein